METIKNEKVNWFVFFFCTLWFSGNHSLQSPSFVDGDFFDVTALVDVNKQYIHIYKRTYVPSIYICMFQRANNVTVFVNGIPVFCVETIKNEKVNWFICFFCTLWFSGNHSLQSQSFVYGDFFDVTALVDVYKQYIYIYIYIYIYKRTYVPSIYICMFQRANDVVHLLLLLLLAKLGIIGSYFLAMLANVQQTQRYNVVVKRCC